MNTNEKYQIFISYRRDGGEDLATLLRDRFTALGYKVFLMWKVLEQVILIFNYFVS